VITLFDYHANYFSDQAAIIHIIRLLCGLFLLLYSLFQNTNGISREYSLQKSASMISEAANYHSQAAGAKAANHR
jgi:hypothetical protein